MTRFARAKGSKASNEKTPEDGTPWEIMKEQLLQSKKENDESKKRLESEKQRLDNYEKFLKEQKIQKRKVTWCEFSEEGTKLTHQQKKKKNQEHVSKPGTSESNYIKERSEKDSGKVENEIIKNSKINKCEITNETDIFVSNKNLSQKNLRNSSKKKVKAKVIMQDPEANGEVNNDGENAAIITEKQDNPNKGQKKKKKLLNGQPVRRKEVCDNSFKLIINGKEVQLIRFDGFPIMKKDAERLHELKNNMIKKGIPKSEVQRTIKLERRRAEKALARLKRDVCYNCRKGGHNLSDCPDLKSKIPGVDAADGICFKCGSTEHKQFECKVQKDIEFKFATCFICKQQGHIARQCPDNPKGLYPNGGCCKLCGDVTHLRKDCPAVNTAKEDTTIKLHTLNSDNNIETIGELGTTKTLQEGGTRRPKKIKF